MAIEVHGESRVTRFKVVVSASVEAVADMDYGLVEYELRKKLMLQLLDRLPIDTIQKAEIWMDK